MVLFFRSFLLLSLSTKCVAAGTTNTQLSEPAESDYHRKSIISFQPDLSLEL